jgi:hypothetical protein
MWGAVNQGNQRILLTKGSAPYQDYNMVGNPYPSPVDIGTVINNASAAGNLAGAAFYVWNPSMGAAGQYQAIPINTASPTPYYLQAHTAFQVRAAHNGDSLNFTEANKSAAISTSLLRGQADGLSLSVYGADYHLWNSVHILYNSSASADEDNMLDARLLPSSDFNFYTLSSDKKELAIDSRPFDANATIPLGIHSIYAQDFVIKAENSYEPSGAEIYLHDKLLHKYVPLLQGTEYCFSITNDTSTQGENRFELSNKDGGDTLPLINHPFEISLSPSPFKNEVAVRFSQQPLEKVVITIHSLAGKTVFQKDYGTLQSSLLTLHLATLPAGSYLVEILCGQEKKVTRLVKE